MSAEGLNRSLYPSVDQMRLLFAPNPPEKPAKKFRIGPTLKVCIEGIDLKEVGNLAKKEAFYAGANAGGELLINDTKPDAPKLIITKDVVTECFIEKEIRRHFLDRTVEEDWLKQYTQLADERDEDFSGKIFNLALEQPFPSHFFGGATLIFDLYRTAQEMQKSKITPREDGSETFPLKVTEVVEYFNDIYDERVFIDEAKYMRRENPHLYKYVEDRYLELAEYDADNATEFLYASFGAYHLFGTSSMESGKAPARVPKFLVGFQTGENFERECRKEINFLKDKDNESSVLLGTLLKDGLEEEDFIGAAEGFALVFRSFRLNKEFSEFENSRKQSVDKETAFMLLKREKKAKKAREQAEEEVERQADETIKKIFEQGI